MTRFYDHILQQEAINYIKIFNVTFSQKEFENGQLIKQYMISSFCVVMTRGEVRAWNMAYFKKDIIGEKNIIQYFILKRS